MSKADDEGVLCCWICQQPIATPGEPRRYNAEPVHPECHPDTEADGRLVADGGEQIPALEETAEGPFDDAELVVFTADAEQVEYEPATEWSQDTGIVSYSLWARFDEDHEIPIWVQSQEGTWISFSPDVYGPDEAEPVSQAFIDAVAHTIDADTGDGWGDPTEDAWDDMRDVEKLLWQHLREALLMQRPPEAHAVVHWCDQRRSAAVDGGDVDV